MPRYVLKQPRYIDGRYIAADVEHPVVIELPEGTKIDKFLEPLADEAEPVAVKAKPHFADMKRTAHVVERDKAPEQGKPAKRASDREAI
jgi:hypothetical protein